MPRRLLAVLALFAAACGFTQEKKGEKKEELPKNLYPLAKGSKWEYAAKSGGLDLEQEIEVTDVTEPKKKGERAVATVTVTTGKYSSAEKLSADDKGVYRHANSRAEFDPPLQIAVHGKKPGEKWSRKMDTALGEITMEYEQKAAEKVKVPAGEFDAVVVVQTNKDDKGKTLNVMTTWYAEGVGVVKSTMQFPPYSMELKKYTPAK